MLKKKLLLPNAVNDVNVVGRYIKVLSCESSIFMKALDAQGRVVIDTEVKAGFELVTDTPFAVLTLTSDVEQLIELWASQHQLNYNALSTKPSRSKSYAVNHYGLSQQITPFDAGQSSVKVVSEGLAWWVGGEGVSDETGIYVQAGKVYEHNSAAPLHAYIATRPDQKIVPSSLVTVSATTNINAERAVICGDYIVHQALPTWDTYYTHVQTGVTVKLAEPLEKPLPSQTGLAIGLRGWDKRYLAFVDCSTGTIQVEKVLNPYNADFNAQCVVENEGVIYLLGEGTNSKPSKIITYSNGVWGEKACPLALQSLTVRNAYKDPYTASLYIVCSGGRYFVSDDNLTTVTEIMGLRELTWVAEQPSFTETAIIFSAGSDAFAYVRDSGQLIDIKAAFPTMQAVCAVGRQWIIVADNKLFTSDDMLKTAHVAYTHTATISERPTLCQMRGNELLTWCKTSDNASILKMMLDADLDSPKAKFKVFKESY